MAANLLAKRLHAMIKSGEAKVSLISDSKYHAFQRGLLEIAFEGKNPRNLIREERSLVNRNVTYIEEKVDRIDLHQQEVSLESGRKLAYDYLIIATGSVPNPDAIPGLSSGALNFHTGPEQSLKIWNAIQQLEKGRVVVGIAGVPHKCPPSPNEATFLLDDYLRKHGKRDQVTITFLTPYPRPYPAEPMSKVVEPLFEKKGIELVTFFNVESVDPIKKELYSLEGETASYDLLIMVPPHRGADVIIKSRIGDQDGWIPTDKHTMKIAGYENAYAIGDATNIPVSKTGVTAHLEAIIATSNIVSSILKLGELHKYTGRINCPFEMGGGKAAFVVGSYEDPVHQIQSGRWDWLLNAYFGKTDIVERQPSP